MSEAAPPMCCSNLCLSQSTNQKVTGLRRRFKTASFRMDWRMTMASYSTESKNLMQLNENNRLRYIFLLIVQKQDFPEYPKESQNQMNLNRCPFLKTCKNTVLHLQLKWMWREICSFETRTAFLFLHHINYINSPLFKILHWSLYEPPQNPNSSWP